MTFPGPEERLHRPDRGRRRGPVPGQAGVQDRGDAEPDKERGVRQPGRRQEEAEVLR